MWSGDTVEHESEQLAPMLEALSRACAAVGRDRADVEISAMWIPAMGLDSLRQYADRGVGRLIVPLQALGGNPLHALDGLADGVLAALSARIGRSDCSA